MSSLSNQPRALQHHRLRSQQLQIRFRDPANADAEALHPPLQRQPLQQLPLPLFAPAERRADRVPLGVVLLRLPQRQDKPLEVIRGLEEQLRGLQRLRRRLAEGPPRGVAPRQRARRCREAARLRRPDAEALGVESNVPSAAGAPPLELGDRRGGRERVGGRSGVGSGMAASGLLSPALGAGFVSAATAASAVAAAAAFRLRVFLFLLLLLHILLLLHLLNLLVGGQHERGRRRRRDAVQLSLVLEVLFRVLGAEELFSFVWSQGGD